MDKDTKLRPFEFLPAFWRNSARQHNRNFVLLLIIQVMSTQMAQCLNLILDPLIISKFLQFRTFWSQTKALFIIRCTLSVESWFKTFRVQKWPYWVQNFEFLLHKITNFRGISGWQWTMPNGWFAKKNHSKFFCSC